MNEYIVWVGGTIIYEGKNKSVADRRKKQFVDWGYDDVVIETNRKEQIIW